MRFVFVEKWIDGLAERERQIWVPTVLERVLRVRVSTFVLSERVRGYLSTNNVGSELPPSYRIHHPPPPPFKPSSRLLPLPSRSSPPFPSTRSSPSHSIPFPSACHLCCHHALCLRPFPHPQLPYQKHSLGHRPESPCQVWSSSAQPFGRDLPHPITPFPAPPLSTHPA